jgi:hypothetical protein
VCCDVMYFPPHSVNRKDGARPALSKLVLNFLIGMDVPNVLLLCMLRSLYPVYCLCVNVYCTAATVCQLNCS